MKLHLRIFFSFMTGVILLLCAIAVTMYSFQKGELVAALEAKIHITEQSVNSEVNNQQQTLIASVKSIAEDSGLKHAIGRNDTNTIISALDSQKQRVNADDALFFGVDGRVAGSNVVLPPELHKVWQDVINRDEVDALQLVRIGEDYFHVVLAEIKVAQKIGWLCMTFRLSELKKTISQSSKRNNVKIAIVDTESTSKIVVASHDLQIEEYADVFASSAFDSSQDFKRLKIGASDAIAKVVPLQQGDRFQVSVFGFTDDALTSLDKFWQHMAVLLVSFAILSLLMTFLIAKGITRPLNLLLSTAKELESGDFSSEINIERADEIGDLATAFKRMQKAISERDQEVQDSLKLLKHQARHDTLTGLANRRMLSEELEFANQASLERGERYNVCILDLDRFKVVNDTSGHAAGDALLVQIGEILRQSVYVTDCVVRLGGDEFALLLRDCESNTALRICNRIRKKIEELVFYWEGSRHRIGVSIGVLSVSAPVANTSEILQRADVGCFIAKENGRNQVHLVAEGSTSIAEKRDELHWVQRLETAIDSDHLVLFAQPIIRLAATQEPQRMEVLVRLRNYATGKLIPPGAFIPTAERYGLSSKIDRWVITQLLKIAPVYSDLFGENRTYWVNLSGNSLSDEAFVDFLESMVSRNLLPVGSLNFEITETAAIRNIKETSEIMRRLKKLGCRFALDDFGSGLSSFGYLKLLPVDYLKIDGMFIRNIVDDKIDRMFVKSIIDIAHAMGMQTVAEFVENNEILDVVTELGADYGQGFGLGRPQELLPEVVSTRANSAMPPSAFS
ncbi:MAG: EAL domain-containing protein [Pseudomonadales bacterium]